MIHRVKEENKIKIDNTCISELTITFYKLFSKSTFIALSQGMKIFKITSYNLVLPCAFEIQTICAYILPLYFVKNDQNANFSLYFKMIAFFYGKFYKLSPQRDFFIVCTGI